MRLALATVAAAALLASSLAAHADTITTFDASGTFRSGSTLSGTITIDTTTGFVTGINLDVGSPDSLDFQTVVSQQNNYSNNENLVQASPTTASPEDLYLVLPGTSLVGYSGGIVSDTTGPPYAFASDIGGSAYVEDLFSGTLTVAPTPEPNSLVLLGTGLLGVVGVVRRRFARGVGVA